ncbi:NAD(P)H-binding domain-containing protein [Hirsutella rhossiliensis]|uniref:NAD(P)H-binding domain-containing protein n=1 Tax=Hirsutella rhossiliensis TaxID=111463 RepID=A0A9P8MPE5_9HYPO|nr:NAD(P)H-binding domain-containing protein [Hirsutella rhossiliensis]KAH0958785.1 NAD(P)H-binding domain-containing protein [Hirsutella rhossiliensis]
MSSPAAVIGSTGLVGSHILSTLLASAEAYQPVYTITRRAPKAAAAADQQQQLQTIVDADTSKWAAALSGLAPVPAAVFSALGTTRAAAGSIQNQWKIDHDLNVELARAAKEAGVATFVFVSSGGTRGMLSGMAPYSKMKNGVEDVVRDLGFDHAVILKPGVILGQREQSRFAEGLAQTVARGLGRLGAGVQDMVGQDADVIARAAVRAAQLAAQGKAPAKYWVVEASDIVRLGRTEWPAAPETSAT